jgi:predicted transcriptional regulator
MSTTGWPSTADPDAVRIPPELYNVAKQVGQAQRPVVTVRVLLSWFWGSKRRGRWIVSVIREALDKLNLSTEPDFDSTYIDGPVTFIPKAPKTVAATATIKTEASVSADAVLIMADSATAALEMSIDPTYRIGRLDIANRPLSSVSPDAAITQAITIMLTNDFSQVPVMTSEREVKGLFSWKSLGSRWSQGHNCTRVGEAMDQHSEISTDASIFTAIDLLRQHDCVLVRDSTKKISGIITSYDISVTFRELAEPFLILDEIENHIRRLIEGNFTKEELGAARDLSDPERQVEGVKDLTLGECMRLLENPAGWEKLALRIDRTVFIKDLDEIRRIRNDVMHFDPEGTDESDLKKLRDFVGFLRRLQEIRLRTPIKKHE